LIVVSALFKINSIKATSKPFSEMSRNRTEGSGLEVVEGLQQQIIEESTTFAAKKTSFEPVQKKNDELTKSHDTAFAEVQATRLRIEELTKSHDAAIAEVQAARLQIEELTKSHDAAIAEVQAARLQTAEMVKKLEAETEKVRVIQKKLKQVQMAVAELKSTIKL
jgi:chromosome segregation ATPase